MSDGMKSEIASDGAIKKNLVDSQDALRVQVNKLSRVREEWATVLEKNISLIKERDDAIARQEAASKGIEKLHADLQASHKLREDFAAKNKELEARIETGPQSIVDLHDVEAANEKTRAVLAETFEAYEALKRENTLIVAGRDASDDQRQLALADRDQTRKDNKDLADAVERIVAELDTQVNLCDDKSAALHAELTRTKQERYDAREERDKLRVKLNAQTALTESHASQERLLRVEVERLEAYAVSEARKTVRAAMERDDERTKAANLRKVCRDVAVEVWNVKRDAVSLYDPMGPDIIPPLTEIIAALELAGTPEDNTVEGDDDVMAHSFSAYQKDAARTMTQPSDAQSKSQLGVYGLGLAGESGEVVELIKKHVGHGHDLDKDRLMKELGDVLWYLAAIATACDVTLDDVATTNIDKLRKRYPDGFSHEASQNREGDDDSKPKGELAYRDNNNDLWVMTRGLWRSDGRCCVNEHLTDVFGPLTEVYLDDNGDEVAS